MGSTGSGEFLWLADTHFVSSRSDFGHFLLKKEKMSGKQDVGTCCWPICSASEGWIV